MYINVYFYYFSSPRGANPLRVCIITTALKTIDEHLSDNHVEQAYQGLRRLQMFYAIPASKMAAGISHHNDRVFGDPLNGNRHHCLLCADNRLGCTCHLYIMVFVIIQLANATSYPSIVLRTKTCTASWIGLSKLLRNGTTTADRNVLT